MRFFKWLLFVSIFIFLAGCAGPQTASRSVGKSVPLTRVSPAEKTTPAVSTVIGTARKMLGAPYRFGGATPSGFDCSGLVSYVYRSAGIRVPRSSNEQFRQSAPVSLQNLRPGDLLFFRLSPPKVSHVGIYDRDGRFIHAPSSGKRVSYASLDNPYWKEHLVAAGRF